MCHPRKLAVAVVVSWAEAAVPHYSADDPEAVIQSVSRASKLLPFVHLAMGSMVS